MQWVGQSPADSGGRALWQLLGGGGRICHSLPCGFWAAALHAEEAGLLDHCAGVHPDGARAVPSHLSPPPSAERG